MRGRTRERMRAGCARARSTTLLALKAACQRNLQLWAPGRDTRAPQPNTSESSQERLAGVGASVLKDSERALALPTYRFRRWFKRDGADLAGGARLGGLAQTGAQLCMGAVEGGRARVVVSVTRLRRLRRVRVLRGEG
eukprot:5363903-Pleurochrysis_carterae.AAC.1